MVVRLDNLEQELTNAYDEFFRKICGIDEKNGRLKKQPKRKKGEWKFPTYPFIGSNYGESKRILFIGLDLGKDEKKFDQLKDEEKDTIQSFKYRRDAIQGDPSKHRDSPHMAGTYWCALFFLKNDLNWGYWDRIEPEWTFKDALEKLEKLLPKENPLNYIAIRNYYLFVREKREFRSGAENRTPIDREKEENFLINEIKILDPDIIIFQGTEFTKGHDAYENFILTKLKKNLKIITQIFVGPHPAFRKKGGRRLKHFVEDEIQIVEEEIKQI